MFPNDGERADMDIKDKKKKLSEVLKQIKIVDETFTGEITIGVNTGGVTFIRKSETFK